MNGYPFDLVEVGATKDGVCLVIRPLFTHDDLKVIFATLNRQLFYDPACSFFKRLDGEEDRYLTGLDYTKHLTLVAIERQTFEVIGIARYHKLIEMTGARLGLAGFAESSIVVAESWRGRGIGSLLFDRLRSAARRHKIRGFVSGVCAQSCSGDCMIGRCGYVLRHGTLEGFERVWFGFDDRIEMAW